MVTICGCQQWQTKLSFTWGCCSKFLTFPTQAGLVKGWSSLSIFNWHHGDTQVAGRISKTSLESSKCHCQELLSEQSLTGWHNCFSFYSLQNKVESQGVKRAMCWTCISIFTPLLHNVPRIFFLVHSRVGKNSCWWHLCYPHCAGRKEAAALLTCHFHEPAFQVLRPFAHRGLFDEMATGVYI